MWYVTLSLTSHTLIPREESPEEEQVNTLRRIFKELPRENYFICRQMFHLMLVVSLSASSSRMSASNIAKVIGPNLLFPPPEQAADPFSIITKTNQINDVLEVGVKHYADIFERDTCLFEDDSLDKDEMAGALPAIFHRRAYGHAKSITACVLTSDGARLWTSDSKGAYNVWNAQVSQIPCV
jgi:hypothetical protein